MKSRKRQTKNRSLNYQILEARQMLTVNVGQTIPDTSTFDPTSAFVNPDISGDIGPNHTIETVNGEYDVRLVDGTLVQRRTMQQFWQSAGADIVVGFDELNNPLLGSIEDTRVLYDTDTGNWFVTSVLADTDGSAIAGNQILLAVSRTSNPVDGFQSVQFVGDTENGLNYNSSATLAVDGRGVFITTNNEIDPFNTSVSVYAIPKFDLTGIAPSLSNLERFENMDSAVYGNTIQFATDADGDNPRSLGLGTFDSGSNQLSVIEVVNLGTGLEVMLTNTTVDVETYTTAPDGRQPNDVERLSNVSPDITGNAVEFAGYLWTTHSVEGSGNNSAARWYQIDTENLALVDSGLIEDTNLDFLYPSIDVSSEGMIAVGFTGTGLEQSASSMMAMGFVTFGLDTVATASFSDSIGTIVAGQDNFVIGVDNPWGEYSSTHFDPDDPFSAYTFQQYVSGDDQWSTSIGQANLLAMLPTLNADDNDNDVVLQLSATNSELLEVVIDGVVTDVFELASLAFIDDFTIGLLTINLGDGDDTVTLDNSNGEFNGFNFDIAGESGHDSIFTTDSDTSFLVVTGSTVFGDDSYSGEFLGEEITSGAGTDDFSIALDATIESDWTILSGAGNDIFTLTSNVQGTLELNGGEGDDSYALPLSTLSVVTVIDSIDAENDSLLATGSGFDDELTINNETLIFNSEEIQVFDLFEGLEQVDFDGGGGDDIINIQAIADDLRVLGGDGDDVFNISSNAPANDGNTTEILGALTVDGGDGTNRLNVSNSGGIPVNAVVTTDQISGMTVLPITFTGNFGTGTDGTPGIVLTGSNIASDSFDIRQMLAGNSLLALGLAGEDVFNVRSATIGDVYVDGGANADTYRTTFASENDHSVKVIDSGTDDGRDRYSIRVTQADDTFTVRNLNINSNRNFLNWNENLENLVIDTLGGRDIVTVGSNVAQFVRIALDEGDDVGIVDGSLGISTIKFQGEAGDDQFDFQNSVAASFVQALGGDGNDEFLVGATSFARSRVDGMNGDDSVQVFFAARDNRRVNARDTGDGTDELLITGTMAADRVDLRNKLVSRDGEFVTYDANTDAFDMELIGSNDVLNIFGSSVLEFDANLGVGNDTVNVFSTSTPNATVGFDVSLSSGNDSANIFRIAENARVHLFGQTGNDVFNVGSNSADNDGSLTRIRGELFVQGGSDTPGVDTLQVNDFAALANFSYTISDTQFASSGTVDRPFNGFAHSGMEFIFAGGTDSNNTFFVTPSTTAVIRVLGKGGFDRLVLNSDEPREIFGDASEGFIEFSQGSKNVSFLGLEEI